MGLAVLGVYEINAAFGVTELGFSDSGEILAGDIGQRRQRSLPHVLRFELGGIQRCDRDSLARIIGIWEVLVDHSGTDTSQLPEDATRNKYGQSSDKARKLSALLLGAAQKLYVLIIR